MYRFLFRLAALLVGLGVATPVWAMDTGQCYPAQQVRDALASENMKPIIVGNRSGYVYLTSLIFMANGDGSRGYLVRGDKPFGERADIICIDSVFRDVKLHDISKPGIPAWALMGDDPTTAEAICKRYRLGYQEKCMSNDVGLKNLNANGQRVLFMAVGTAINPRDQTIRSDQRIILTLDGALNGGVLNASTGDGASYILAAYTSAALTQNAAASLYR